MLTTIACLFLAISAGDALAQTSRETIGWYIQAQALERANRPMDAVGYYRRVWEVAPARSDAVLRGTRLLAENGKKEDAAAWLAAATAGTPQETVLWVEYGDLYDRTGEPSKADSIWRQGSIRSSDVAAFHIGVADRLVSRREHRRAQEWLLAGVEKTGGQRLLSRRLFDVAVELGDPVAAAQAASDFVSGDNGLVREVLDNVRERTLTAHSTDSLASAATRMSDQFPEDAARALFAAEMQLAAASEADAARLFVRAAGRSPNPASAMASSATELERRGHLLASAFVDEQLAIGYPQSPFAQRSALTAATALADEGLNDRARALLEWVIGVGVSPFEDDARIAYATMLLRADSLEEAYRQFSVVASRGRSLSNRRAGAFGQAECELRAGRLEDAERHWEALADSTMTQTDGARVHLRLAESALYRGDASTMYSRCEAVVRKAAGSDEANDCLRLQGILAEAGSDTVSWRKYGLLEYAMARGQHDSVLTAAPGLFGTPLEGRSRLISAEAELAMGSSVTAAAHLKSLVSSLDSSAVGEEALWRYAEVQRARLRDPGEELRAYEKLQTTYPNSVYLGHARRRMRELRAQMGAL